MGCCMRIAVIKNDVVENILLGDQTFLDGLEPDLELTYIVVEGIDCNVGGIWLGGTIFAKPEPNLNVLKVAKNKQINEWRLQANETSFTYNGHHIAADIVSKFDITITNGEILDLGALPPNWLGAWKRVVHTVYVPIPDVATWKAFHSALFNQGLTNFNHAQDLKLALANANTPEQIAEIVW